MSLLEDVFLEDEANEAQELERVIEGDEYDEQQRAPTPDSDGNSVKEDEAEEAKRVDPNQSKKRVVRNPRVTLNPARLTGPRGIQVIPDHFKDFKFKGKGHEKEDLDLIMKKLEHWAYRLYPKFEFEDCLKKIETLGKKRPVMVHLTKIRTDQYTSEETVVQRDSSDDEMPAQEEDEFDKLLEQQIALARSTPAPGSVKKIPETDRVKTQAVPKAVSSPSISDEQRNRMLRNRQLAEERRLAKLKLTQNEITTTDSQKQHIEETSQNNENKDTSENIEITQNKANDKINDFDSLKEIDTNIKNSTTEIDANIDTVAESNEDNCQIDNEVTNNVCNTNSELEMIREDSTEQNGSNKIEPHNENLIENDIAKKSNSDSIESNNQSIRNESKDDEKLSKNEKSNDKEISDVTSVDFVMDVDFSDDF